MKILFDHAHPFLLAHGGFQIQIEETKYALEQMGIEVEWLRWWDGRQTGDVIHFFGVPSLSYIQRANTKSIPVIFTHLLTATCNRADWKLRLQGLLIRTLLKTPGWGLIKNQLSWQSLQSGKQIVVGLEAEKRALQLAFNVPEEKISIVPLGTSDAFLKATAPKPSGDYLITTSTIYEGKRSVELAQMAHTAGVPLLFVGKPFSESTPYWHKFQSLIDGHLVRHISHVEDRHVLLNLLQQARGFVIFSRAENWCLSAHEAAACGLPLLVPNQKWSRERFGAQASYLEPNDSLESNATRLKKFYDAAPALPPPAISIPTWTEVAERLATVYRQLRPTP